MSHMYDMAVIGSGPSGLSAAVNGKIRNKDIIVFGSIDLSSKLMKAPRINNYLGFYNIRGTELKQKFSDHIKSMGIDILYEHVGAVYSMGDYFSITAGRDEYTAKSVIIAAGVDFTRSIVGEDEFLGRGVSYCATCDAPLYKNKRTAIIGYNKEAENEANFMSEICSKVFYIPMNNSSPEVKSGIEVIKDVPVEIKGDKMVSKLVLKNSEVEVDGVFIIKDSIKPDKLVPGLEMEDGYIKVNRNMETNIRGCYAAGDCTGKPYQYMKSCGEGQVAALNACDYIDRTVSKGLK